MIEFSDIKIVIMDVDGVLTDGIYQISERGEIIKSFYTRDFFAIEKLLRNDIKVIIITQSKDNVINKKIENLKSQSDFWYKQDCHFKFNLLTGVEDKVKEILDITAHYDYGFDNVAYIGDAENDVQCMKKALFTGCPIDAIKEVKDNSNYISDFPGGRGAVYDFCMYILKMKEEENDDNFKT